MRMPTQDTYLANFHHLRVSFCCSFWGEQTSRGSWDEALWPGRGKVSGRLFACGLDTRFCQYQKPQLGILITALDFRLFNSCSTVSLPSPCSKRGSREADGDQRDTRYRKRMRARVYNGNTLKKINYLDENEGEEKAYGGGWEEMLRFPWQPSFLPHP